VVFRPIPSVPAIGLYLSWNTDNPSPLARQFFSLLESTL